MKLTLEQLKAKLPTITALLFTHPQSQDDRATEVWLKFREEGVYAYINLEQPMPPKITMQKLVGKGDALNCSEAKRDDLCQYSFIKEIVDILKKSYDFKGNLKDTVLKVEELFDDFNGSTLFQ